MEMIGKIQKRESWEYNKDVPSRHFNSAGRFTGNIITFKGGLGPEYKLVFLVCVAEVKIQTDHSRTNLTTLIA